MRKKILIGSMQVNNGFSGQYYLPYSIGLLCTYVKKHSNKANNLEFALPIYRREEKSDLISKLNGIDILIVSLYVWNKNISLAVAKDLKKINPNLLILFGGPSVPNDASEFMLEHDYIDVCVHQEGEQTFLDIINKFPDSGSTDIQGIDYSDIEALVIGMKKILFVILE